MDRADLIAGCLCFRPLWWWLVGMFLVPCEGILAGMPEYAAVTLTGLVVAEPVVFIVVAVLASLLVLK